MEIEILDWKEQGDIVNVVFTDFGQDREVQIYRDNLLEMITDDGRNHWVEDYAGWDGEHRTREGIIHPEEYLKDNYREVLTDYIITNLQEVA